MHVKMGGLKEMNLEVPLRCTGVAQVLIKRTGSDYKVLLLKRVHLF